MGSVGKQNSQSSMVRSTMEEPVLGFTTYKSTPEMKDFVMSIAKEIQSDFPLLDRSFTINFNKFQTNAGEVRAGSSTNVDLSGAFFKKELAQGHIDYLRGVVAHELTHIMQNRFGFHYDSPGHKEFMDKMWDSAVDRYRAQHPESISVEGINKAARMLYGHVRTGNNSAEKIAVAVEQVYRKPNSQSDIAEIGRILISDLKKMKEKR